jgi:hypothetical protein
MNYSDWFSDLRFDLAFCAVVLLIVAALRAIRRIVRKCHRCGRRGGLFVAYESQAPGHFRVVNYQCRHCGGLSRTSAWSPPRGHYL